MIDISGEFQFLFQLGITAILCGLIGLEREIKRKGAGLQTYSLVGLSACAFTVLVVNLFYRPGAAPMDLSRVIQAVASGIGFLGAGLIFRGNDGGVEGLTTAAGLLLVSAIGIAAGIEEYSFAVLITAFMLFVLVIFGLLEKKFFEK